MVEVPILDGLAGLARNRPVGQQFLTGPLVYGIGTATTRAGYGLSVSGQEPAVNRQVKSSGPKVRHPLLPPPSTTLRLHHAPSPLVH